jgi:hypothetical protein
MTVPTVDDILARTQITPNLNWWVANCTGFRVSRDKLRQALEDAYDPDMTDWPAMVEVEVEDA